MKQRSTITLALLALLLNACQPLVTPTPAAAPTATRLPAAAASASLAGEASVPTPSLRQKSGGLPTSSLFDVAWDDRSPFSGGLIDSGQAVLEQLPGASVYHIDLKIADDLIHLQGREAVYYTNREEVPLESIVLRLFPNLTGGGASVSNLSVDGTNAAAQFELADSAMRVRLAEPLQPGEQAVIAMDFAVEVPVDESSNYGTFAFLDGVLALAHFYPMIAVFDDEGWNAEIPSPAGDIIYADSSFYLVRVTAPDDLVVVASGVTLDEQHNAGRQTLTFASGPARDFYLVASQDYSLVSQQVGQTTVNSAMRPGLEDGAELALRFAADSLRSFEEHFGPYPYTEFDVVPTATSALGVEYPGIVAIAERVYDGNNLRFLEATVAHEVAHQWFYNVVGNDQIDEPWLDEALAQYATLLYFQDLYGQAGYDGFRSSLSGRWERVDNAAIPIGLPVAAYEGREYGAIVYGRAPLFLEVLEEQMGVKAFASFLRDYYQSHSWEIATTESFKQTAERHCNCDLTPLFAAWVYP